jgi:hypothetical protein
MIQKPSTFKKGYTLLFAVLISSLMLGIGLAILTISRKELLLSSAGRESQFAFYAADTGAECAMYWDFGQRDAYNQSTPSPTIRCNAQVIPLSRNNQIATTQTDTYTFTTSLSIDSARAVDRPCAYVTIYKTYEPAVNPPPGSPAYQIKNTVIESRGRNTCDTNDPRAVERALRIKY